MRTRRRRGTVTWPTGGSGSARIIRSSVDRLTPIPSRVASREPARPANAKQIASSAACRPGLRCACRSVNPVPARRMCKRCSRRGRRRTGAPSTTLPPAGSQRADPPDGVGTGCAPGSTSAHTGGNANPGPVDARRSPPCRPPGRSGRSPPATDAETEPGNSTHQPQPREHHATARPGFTQSGPEPARWH